MKNQGLNTDIFWQLDQLLAKQSWLRKLKKETQKERQKFDFEILELETSFLKARSEKERKQIIQKGEQVYQDYQKKITALLNLAKEI